MSLHQKTQKLGVLVGVRLGLAIGGAATLLACGAAEPARDYRANANLGELGRAVADPPNAKPVVVAAAISKSAAEASCPADMVSIDGHYCIDRYEASLVEVLSDGERSFSPYSTLGEQHVRAVSLPNVHPQGYISARQAAAACRASGKRLCRASEWTKACRGPENKQYGYGDHREVGRCNDNGKNPVMSMFGPRYNASTMNRQELNQMRGTLAKTGERAGCSNGYGVHDMVGNLHEWIADPRGAFFGGYYQDVSSFGHGEGCGYSTTAHEARYHDYSTGFRCCADLESMSEDPMDAPILTSSRRPTPKKPVKTLRTKRR